MIKKINDKKNKRKCTCKINCVSVNHYNRRNQTFSNSNIFPYEKILWHAWLELSNGVKKSSVAYE